MSRIAFAFATLLFFTFLSQACSAGVEAPLTWEGSVIALGGKQDSSHYEFRITNMSVEERGGYYVVRGTVIFTLCELYRNGTVVRGCPVERKTVNFTVKKDTNTFMLSGRPAFFFLYWPEFSANGTFYTSGVELRAIPVLLYTKNFSRKNCLGWGVSLQSKPFRILRCRGWSFPEDDEPMRCIEDRYENFTIDMSFKGPYLVDGSLYFHADPFGVIKGRDVIMFIDIEKTPEAMEFIKNVKSITPPSYPSWPEYIPYALGAGVVGIVVAAIRRRR